MSYYDRYKYNNRDTTPYSSGPSYMKKDKFSGRQDRPGDLSDTSINKSVDTFK